MCARYQFDPKVSHANHVKRILKYLNGTSDYGILYSHGSSSALTGYYDADWAGSVDDRKVHQEDVSFWETTSYLGSARSKIVCLYPLLRLSILMQEAVVLNWFG